MSGSQKFIFFVVFVFLMAIVIGACAEGSPDPDQEITRPEGWSEETHGDNVDANYDLVFEEGVVHRLDVTIVDSDWQTMLDDMTFLYGEFGQGEIGPPGPPPMVNEDQTLAQAPGGVAPGMDVNPIWVPCTVNYNGHQWLHVGIRFKGNSSLRSTWSSGIYKLPMRLDFDEFEDESPEIHDQRFYGFQKLSLSSNWKDDSLLREKITADIFREAGVPAPRTAFYRLYIDHGDGPVYFGLYTMVEIPSTSMLNAQFSGDGGNLYKPEGPGATFAVYDENSFDKETNKVEADYSDVESLYETLHADRGDTETWRTELESVFNVSGFIRWLAVNTIIQNWDTYGRMSHNYFLYNDPTTGLLNWIPWDNNEALRGSELEMRGTLSLPLTEVTDGWPLIRYLMDDPIYYDMYIADILEIVNYVFYPDYMQPMYEAAHELIRPYVLGPEGEIEGHSLLPVPVAFETALTYLNTHVEERYTEAMTFISNPYGY